HRARGGHGPQKGPIRRLQLGVPTAERVDQDGTPGPCAGQLVGPLRGRGERDAVALFGQQLRLERREGRVVFGHENLHGACPAPERWDDPPGWYYERISAPGIDPGGRDHKPNTTRR